MFPTTTFRLAYDRLRSDGAKRADRDYVRILHLAVSTRGGQMWKPRCRSYSKQGNPRRLRLCVTWCKCQPCIRFLPSTSLRLICLLTINSFHQGGAVSNAINRHNELQVLLERLKLAGMAACFADLALKAMSDGQNDCCARAGCLWKRPFAPSI